ncbi:MAG TPA: response regulator transcription factor [Anaerolineales bacterium]|nr:response regulator transcription factor [Anaerolineales bacterium]
MIIAPGMAVRAGLRALLSDDPRLQVIGEVANPRELDSEQDAVDVFVWSPAQYIDQDAERIELGHLNLGEESALLVIHDDPRLITQLTQLRVKAWGVLDPEATQTELIAAIQSLYEGLVVVDPAWLRQALANQDPGNDKYPDQAELLTERETEVLQLLAYGLTNKQIAARLNISAHTVKFHVSSIFTKMRTTNRVEAVNLGLKRGLIML